MPKDFTKCVKSKGSKVITIKPNSDHFINVCYDKKGKAHSGEVKKTKQECIDEIASITEESTTTNTAMGKDTALGKPIKKPMPNSTMKKMLAKKKHDMSEECSKKKKK